MTLEETSLGFYRAWHIGIGAKHGLFVALRDAPLAPDDLAKELGLDRAALARWSEGAWALGLLTRDANGRVRLARAYVAGLGEPSSPRYMGHHFEYLTTKSLTFGALDDMFQGTPVTVDLAPTYAIATRWDHTASLQSLPEAMRRALVHGCDVLDLGAGHGGWTRAAQPRFPRSRFSASDLRLAPLRALDGARIFASTKIPRAAFDLVHMGEVLAATHDPAALLTTAHHALRPGGRLLLLEGLRPEPDQAPKTWGEALVLAMGLDFSMDGSRYLTLAALKTLLRDTGFRSTRSRDLGGSLYLITARV